ncbi:hypothetical protein [Metabacillus fastidiosus]|uniref:hypothetical protein n=1 Tax=Metabacillus fastidiosus TaxID=1458 RepID=UPI002E21C6D6|nr:hypothetical protein [Metabacillus fastidiosus]
MILEKQEPININDERFYYDNGSELPIFLTEVDSKFLADKNRYLVPFVEHGVDVLNYFINKDKVVYAFENLSDICDGMGKVAKILLLRDFNKNGWTKCFDENETFLSNKIENRLNQEEFESIFCKLNIGSTFFIICDRKVSIDQIKSILDKENFYNAYRNMSLINLITDEVSIGYIKPMMFEEESYDGNIILIIYSKDQLKMD